MHTINFLLKKYFFNRLQCYFNKESPDTFPASTLHRIMRIINSQTVRKLS